jgi:hypothetical protein
MDYMDMVVTFWHISVNFGVNQFLGTNQGNLRVTVTHFSCSVYQSQFLLHANEVCPVLFFMAISPCFLLHRNLCIGKNHLMVTLAQLTFAAILVILSGQSVITRPTVRYFFF